MQDPTTNVGTQNEGDRYPPLDETLTDDDLQEDQGEKPGPYHVSEDKAIGGTASTAPNSRTELQVYAKADEDIDEISISGAVKEEMRQEGGARNNTRTCSESSQRQETGTSPRGAIRPNPPPPGAQEQS